MLTQVETKKRAKGILKTADTISEATASLEPSYIDLLKKCTLEVKGLKDKIRRGGLYRLEKAIHNGIADLGKLLHQAADPSVHFGDVLPFLQEASLVWPADTSLCELTVWCVDGQAKAVAKKQVSAILDVMGDLTTDDGEMS